MKPFRPPLLRKAPSVASTSLPIDQHPASPPAKRRKLEAEAEKKRPSPQLVFKVPGVSNLPRKPLYPVQNPASAKDGSAVSSERPPEAYYNVLWRKQTNKKHKTWDGDGILRVVEGYGYLQDVTSGREMGRAVCNSPLLPESKMSVAGREVEVDSVMTREDFLAGRSFLSLNSDRATPAVLDKPLPKPKLVPKAASVAGMERTKKPMNVPPPKSTATQTHWKNPMLVDTIMAKPETKEPTPRHDPSIPGAILMKRPSAKEIPRGKQVVDVVVDPLLSKHLREHQREGVKFLYECVMGMRSFSGQGAILADEMGLGKTLQTIALLWTLLKQNPIHEESPVIKKALIVCPATLINNWKKEFRKWLGNERIGVFVADGTKTRLTDFTKGKSYSVMIIGYEKLRNVQEELKRGAAIDIVIADEGHRLKTAQNKSAQAIKSLNTARRVILSGTPIQNDLSEFFMMVDFVNPGLLGNFKAFTKQFEVPIMKSRQPAALSKDVELGEGRSEELATETAKFILRRTSDILAKYLPSKTEYVLMCRPTSVQASVYNHVLASPSFQSALGSPEAHLQLITILKKVCNSPRLLVADTTNNPEKVINPMTASLISDIPRALLRESAASAKVRVLDQLLYALRENTTEKIVLVSNFTSTLDLLSALLTSLSMPFLRLDGSTPSNKRQDLVDEFNRTPSTTVFAFLLSAKAGGMGINLIGASRLVLFDVDWNPAIDAQAMARIHRDGQKRPCVIYRLLLAGGLDEKMWQRQVTKIGLANSVMEQKGGTSNFTREELKDLFRLDESETCQTHKLIGCNCGGKGMLDSPVLDADLVEDMDESDDDVPDVATMIKASQVNMEEQERKIRAGASSSKGKDGKAKMQSLMAYSHIDTSKFATEEDADMEALIGDDILMEVLKDEGNRVSFVFAKTSG